MAQKARVRVVFCVGVTSEIGLMMKEEASLGESGSVRPDLGFARMLWSLSSLGMCNIGLCNDTTIPPLELETLS